MARIKWKDHGYKAFLQKARKLNGSTLEVGYPEPSKQGAIAMIHEFGASALVTPKMRAFFFNEFGINLKKSKREIKIPERSFLRAGFDKYQDEVLKQAALALDHYLFGNMSENQYLDMVGLLMAGKLKRFAIDLESPPNSGFTAQQKGSSNPLVDSGKMIGAITWKVKK